MTFKVLFTAVLFLSLISLEEPNPCADASAWKDLLNHQISAAADEKITALRKKGKFNIQTLDKAGGKIINLDYFPVTIKTFPKNPETGAAFSPETFLNYLRLHFNDFINPAYAVFSPSEKTGFNEKALWESGSPLGVVIHIHIPLPAGDGSVICTEYAPDHWVYATLRTPWRPFSTGYDGKHPVSGYRQVGFIKNCDGSYTYYTKGVDKMTAKMQAKMAETFMKNPFKEADKLWESLRKGISDFVEKNGGSAVPLEATPPEIHHYKWKELKKCSNAKEK